MLGLKVLPAAIINMNQPGHYLQWSILTISVANLIIIAVMVVIFGLALLLPFPKEKYLDQKDSDNDKVSATSNDNDTYSNGMWTAAVRRAWLRVLPPKKLLPDKQPAYVASWIYVFGVASLAAFAMAIISGVAIAFGGPDWWHYNPIGHFFNSMHLWSVELFMALMVIHLWGKFWMAAWRGRRALTWMTGVVAFATSILMCFTGYLSQQNFDSQWISTNGKDAIDATGLGAFFNVMNGGEMLLWHVVLIPIALVAFIGAHILLVRIHGVSHPLPEERPKGRAAKHVATIADATEWRGPNKRFDIVKEGAIATAVVFALVVVLAGLLSSPNDPPITISTWANVAPADFMATTASELAGTSETANYGPPYNNGTANVQKIGVSWQMLAGVRSPIDPAQTFVLSPLSTVAPTDPDLARALDTYQSATAAQQQSWDQAYLNAVTSVTFNSADMPVVPAANDGPVPSLISTELTLARSGAIDADLLAQQPFYGTNYSKPLLFLEDGSYMASIATNQHLKGNQWGVMNETGSYPGQPWMWLYTIWYQVSGFSTSPNADLIAIYLTALGTGLLLFVPFIPGLRDIPRFIPIHRLVWKQWNNRHKVDKHHKV